jgi:hypothetical protein
MISGMTEPERDAFLAAFSVEQGETLTGFAVLGGIFGERIDLVGERLIGAVIVGVGLPQLCVERDLIRDYFQQQNAAGFDYACTFPGMNRVLHAHPELGQAAGSGRRLLETVVMIEQRIAWGANNTGQAAIPQVRKMTVKEMKFKFCSPAFIPLTNRSPIAPGHIAHSVRGKSQPQQSSRPPIL